MAPFAFDLSQDVLEFVLAKVTHTKDRNACSLVCKRFMSAERHTRRSLRLRCTQREVGNAPACFPSITSLDISDIVPRDAAGTGCTTEQLLHLGKCFPRVRSVTCSDRRAFVDTGALPFTGVWPELQEVIFKNVSDSDAEEDQAASLLGKLEAGRGRLIVTDLNKPAVSERVGLPFKLKEVHFERRLNYSSTMLLTNLNLSSLESISLELWDVCALRAVLLQVLSLENCPLLRSLHLVFHTWGCNSDIVDLDETDEDRPELLTNANLGRLLAQLPPLTFLSIEVVGPCRFSTLRLSSTLVESLRRLDLNLGHGYQRPLRFDLDPIRRCTALEQLGLFGLTDVSLHSFHRQLTSILGGFRSLHSLYMDFWADEAASSYQEAMVVLESIAKAAPPTLTYLSLGESSLIINSSGREFFELATPFRPFNQLLRKLDCSFSAQCDGPQFEFTGWDRLEHLSLARKTIGMLTSKGSPVVILCPSLKSFKIVTDAYVDLTFEGKHEHLATVDINMDLGGEELREGAGVQNLVHLIRDILGTLRALTDLTISADFCSSFYVDRSVTKALASLTSLKVLKIETQWFHDDPLDPSTFDEFLSCPSLRELHVNGDVGWKLLDFYERFYHHVRST